jgi:hypothetical protein
LALAVPPAHELLDVDSEVAAKTEDAWLPADIPAFLFFVTWLPDAVIHRLPEYLEDHRLEGAPDPLQSYWRNHCEHCGTPQDDEELHCEPGVFMPSNETEAANIDLIYVDEPFEAAAAGYAPDPEFVSWPFTSST